MYMCVLLYVEHISVQHIRYMKSRAEKKKYCRDVGDVGAAFFTNLEDRDTVMSET